METSHLCSVARVWSDEFHLAPSILSMFTRVRGRSVPEGAFLDRTVRLAALSLCRELILVALSIKWLYKVNFFIYFALLALGLARLSSTRSFLCSCTAVYQVETHLQLQWKWKNSLMTSHLIPKKEKKISCVEVPPTETKAVHFADTCISSGWKN